MRGALLVALAACVLTGCSTSGMQFRADTRVRIVAPANEATVRLPVTIRWSAQDLTAPAGTSFAMFVDRAPIAPGESVDSLASGDRPCQRTPGCPDENYFNRRHVYTTDKSAVTLEGLIDTRPPSRPGALDRHEVIVILLDSTRHRLGESFYRVDFNVDRSDHAI